MKVTFDRQIFMSQRRGGVSRYFVELAREFRRRPELGVDLSIPLSRSINEHLHELDPRRYRLLGHWPEKGPARSAINRAGRISGGLAPAGWRDADVIHHTYYSPEIIARTPNARRVVTVHDMIHELFPELPGAADSSRRKKQAVEAADAIICVSETTRHDLERLWGSWLHVPVYVVHHGVGAEFSLDGLRHEPGYNYVLFVGMRQGYKAFADFLEAIAIGGAELDGCHVLCVGGGPFTRDELGLIRSHGLSHRVHQESASQADLPAFYRGARLFVYPSAYEGFGMPLLEAMASGCPTVAAETPALREIGGDCSAYFRSGDVEDMARAMAELIMDRDARTGLCLAGIARAEKFRWGSTADSTACVYREILDLGLPHVSGLSD